MRKEGSAPTFELRSPPTWRSFLVHLICFLVIGGIGIVFQIVTGFAPEGWMRYLVFFLVGAFALLFYALALLIAVVFVAGWFLRYRVEVGGGELRVICWLGRWQLGEKAWDLNEVEVVKEVQTSAGDLRFYHLCVKPRDEDAEVESKHFGNNLSAEKADEILAAIAAASPGAADR